MIHSVRVAANEFRHFGQSCECQLVEYLPSAAGVSETLETYLEANSQSHFVFDTGYVGKPSS